MKRMNLLLLAGALSLGALTVPTPSMANHGGCHKNKDVVCPLIFAPVTCDHNKTYSNSCFAAADCATGCVPAS